MVVPIQIICIIILAHYVGDFVFQTQEMALNKSSSNKILLLHIAVYTMCLMGVVGLAWPLLSISLNINTLIAWSIFNGVMHFATDYVSSRLSKKAYAENNIRRFWLIIGADQMVHYLFLFLTWAALRPF